MSVRRTSAHLLAQRSVHLRIIPRPSNLSESREIYRVLQRFGDMTLYKHLRYEYHNPMPNIGLAVYRDADGAQKALDASPIRFALERVVPDDEDALAELEEVVDEDYVAPEAPAKDGIDEILRPSQLINRTPSSVSDTTPTAPPTPPHPPMPLDQSLNIKKTTSKWFQVIVDRSHVVHQDFVERQPFWKQFSPMRSIGQEDLAKKVPHIGLSDISKRPPHAYRTPNKILKQMDFYVKREMPSLLDMYDMEEWERKGA